MAEDGYPCRIPTWQPCDYLIEQILNAFACCFGLCDSFCRPRELYQEGADGTDDPATTEGESDPTTTTAAVRRRPRQPPTSEGRGGQIN